MDITRARLEAKKAELEKILAEYDRQITGIQGALQIVDALIAETNDALTMDELKDALGAQSIGEPEPVK